MKKILFALGLLVSVTTYAQDTYNLCDDSKVYIYDHPQLKKKVDDPIFTKQSPTWEGGQDSLQQFYDKHISYVEKKETPLQQIIMTFVVDCNGNPGEFKFENKVSYAMQEYIMEATKSHMEKWIPAVHKKKNVDCRQVIVFTVANSKLKVKYRSTE